MSVTAPVAVTSATAQVIHDIGLAAEKQTSFSEPVASPGFVARRGKVGNYVMGHSWRTPGPGAAAAG